MGPDGAPVVGAAVALRRSHSRAVTDQLGRFRLWFATAPDTLIVTSIGSRPDTIALQTAPTEPVRVTLAPTPVRLSQINVNTGVESALGRWELPMTAARMIPPAIETDVFRALALAPSVSFSTPLSARPIIRGYDANQSSFRIDGHEVINLYHLGRAFSAFPADAAERVTLEAAPPPVSEGGTLDGVVDVIGQTGGTDRTAGGADLSLVSAAAWAGGGTATRWFGAARAVHFGVIGTATGHRIPYGFQDLYGNVGIGPAKRPVGKITAFASHDRVDDSGGGMTWGNVLLGSRWQLLDRGHIAFSLATSLSRFAEDAAKVHARFADLDVRNRFTNAELSPELVLRWPHAALTMGASIRRRTITNRITPRSQSDFGPTDIQTARAEAAWYGGWTQTIGPVMVNGGMRLDATTGAHAWQPRLRVQARVSDNVSIAAGIGRTARLEQLVADPESEPELAFYDFWLAAGTPGVPVAVVNHQSADLDFSSGAVDARVSVFASSGHGLLEVRPISDAASRPDNAFRLGRSRTRGIEVQAGVHAHTQRSASFSVAYVYSRSDRNWGDGWVPWIEDRRHLIRLLGQMPIGTHWSIFSTIEGASGVPLTPVDQILTITRPGSPAALPTYVYGSENSARSPGTVRLDLGARLLFAGPWRSRMALGLSLINAGWGTVARLVPSSPEVDVDPPGGVSAVRIRYAPLFSLPAIPTVTLRAEF